MGLPPDCVYQHAHVQQKIVYKSATTGGSLLTYLLTYLLIPWCRILLEHLTGLQLVKKFPAFHGTRMFITALTTVRHLSLSWASQIQSIYPHPTSWISILNFFCGSNKRKERDHQIWKPVPSFLKYVSSVTTRRLKQNTFQLRNRVFIADLSRKTIQFTYTDNSGEEYN